MVEKPPRSSFKGMLVLNLDFSSFYPPSLEDFLQSWRLWKTASAQTEPDLSPDHLRFPVADDAENRSAFSQAGRNVTQSAYRLTVWFRDKLRETVSSRGVALK